MITTRKTDRGDTAVYLDGDPIGWISRRRDGWDATTLHGTVAVSASHPAPRDTAIRELVTTWREHQPNR